MSKTVVSGKQIKDGSIQRSDLDVSTTNKAVLTKLVQGSELSLSSTGGDAGTGDVTVTFDSSAVSTALSDVSNLQSAVTSLQAGKPINALSDVIITSPVTGHVIQYNGTNWVNSVLSGSFSGDYNDLTNKPTIPTSVSTLPDVTITSPVSGQLLAYNGTSWVNTNTLSKSAAEKGLVLKGAASQTANLFEIQNSSSTALVQFNSSGQIYSPAVGTRTLTIKGIASQTANLFEVKNSNNNLLFSVSNTGQLLGMNIFGGSRDASNVSTYFGANAGATRGTGGFDGTSALGYSSFFSMGGSNQANVGVGSYSAYYGVHANSVFLGKDSSNSATSSAQGQGLTTFIGAKTNYGNPYSYSGTILGYGITNTITNTTGFVAIGGGSTHSGMGAAQTNIGSGITYQNWTQLQIEWGAGSVGKIYSQAGSYSTGIGAGTGNTQQLLVYNLNANQPAAVFVAPDDMTANYIDANSSTYGSNQLAYRPELKFVVGPRGETYSGQFYSEKQSQPTAYFGNWTYTVSSNTVTLDIGNSASAGPYVYSSSWTKWAFTNMPTDNNICLLFTAYTVANTARPYPDACSVNGVDVVGGIIWPDGVAPQPTGTASDACFDAITFLFIRDSAGTLKVFGIPTLNFI